MPSGTPAAARPSLRRAPEAVELYDFRRPTTLARDHSRVLELAFETFARQWGTQLTAKVRVVSQVTCEQVADAHLRRVRGRAAGHDRDGALHPRGHRRRKAVIQFPTTAALSWVTHMLGGTRPTTCPERKFTQIEQALVGRLMEDALEDLRYSLGSLLVTPISLDGIQYNSQFAQAAHKSDLMIVASFEIRVGERSAAGTVAIPAEVLLPQLGESNPPSTRPTPATARRASSRSVPVDVALQLTPATVPPSAVLDLAVGDLLPLPHPQHRPLDDHRRRPGRRPRRRRRQRLAPRRHHCLHSSPDRRRNPMTGTTITLHAAAADALVALLPTHRAARRRAPSSRDRPARRSAASAAVVASFVGSRLGRHRAACSPTWTRSPPPPAPTRPSSRSPTCCARPSKPRPSRARRRRARRRRRRADAAALFADPDTVVFDLDRRGRAGRLVRHPHPRERPVGRPRPRAASSPRRSAPASSAASTTSRWR